MQEVNINAVLETCLQKWSVAEAESLLALRRARLAKEILEDFIGECRLAAEAQISPVAPGEGT